MSQIHSSFSFSMKQWIALSVLWSVSEATPIPYAHYFDKKMMLPSLLMDPLVALIGETCYGSLIEDFHITDWHCIRYALSKGLGFGIVVGSSIVKVPQILTILSKKSSEGLSLASFFIETMAYCIALAYNVRQHNPFSTFGEVVFMTLQDIAITVLILYYTQQRGLAVVTGLGFFFILYSLSSPWMPSWWMSGLYATTIPLSLASKVPQIYANWQNTSTGQLSVFAVLNYFAGSTARVFTTWTELEDPLMLGGNVLASLLNAVLVLQVILYWNKESKVSKAD
ncbi:hypothetical protein BDF14DRAFT_1779821 [Spinellus fusiger]|nr:hypothetical protein BDF14DRAFT_1779821 [Spinellus fusiger]